jgi:hypothetical protein
VKLNGIIRKQGVAGKVVVALSLSILTTCLPTATASAMGGQDEILVIGTGSITDGNVARARRAAISEALIKGVESYLAQRLGSRGMINNFPRLLQNIIPKARRGIEKFRILAEEQVGAQYKILVRVKINEKLMDEKLREIGLVGTR